MSDGSIFQKLVGALVMPAQEGQQEIDALKKRIVELEQQLVQMNAVQVKLESDVAGIATTTAMLLKSMLRVTLQVQILYDRLGIDLQEELSHIAASQNSRNSEESEDPDEPTGSGGMGGMLN